MSCEGPHEAVAVAGSFMMDGFIGISVFLVGNGEGSRVRLIQDVKRRLVVHDLVVFPKCDIAHLEGVGPGVLFARVSVFSDP